MQILYDRLSTVDCMIIGFFWILHCLWIWPGKIREKQLEKVYLAHPCRSILPMTCWYILFALFMRFISSLTFHFYFLFYGWIGGFAFEQDIFTRYFGPGWLGVLGYLLIPVFWNKTLFDHWYLSALILVCAYILIRMQKLGIADGLVMIACCFSLGFDRFCVFVFISSTLGLICSMFPGKDVPFVSVMLLVFPLVLARGFTILDTLLFI